MALCQLSGDSVESVCFVPLILSPCFCESLNPSQLRSVVSLESVLRHLQCVQSTTDVTYST